MENRAPEVLAVILLFLAVLVLLHQQLTTNDAWFRFQELENHETLITCCIVAGIALMIGKRLGRAG